jgi:hypothetical protein
MSVDAAQAEFLDEPMPESPLKDRLSQALPKAPAGLQWKIGVNVDDIPCITLQSREGAYKGAKEVRIPEYVETDAQIISLIAVAAKELHKQHTRRSILRELSGAYEGEVA